MPIFKKIVNESDSAKKYMDEMNDKYKVRQTEMAVDDLLLNNSGIFAFKSHDDILCLSANSAPYNRQEYFFTSIYINGTKYNANRIVFGSLKLYYVRETCDLFFNGRDYLVKYQDITSELMSEMLGEALTPEQEEIIEFVVKMRNTKDNTPHFFKIPNEDLLFLNGKIIETSYIQDFSRSKDLGIGLYCITPDHEIYFESLKDHKTYHLLSEHKYKHMDIHKILSSRQTDSISVKATAGMKLINGQMLFNPVTQTVYVSDIISNLYVNESTKILTLTQDSWIGVWVEDKMLDYNLETGKTTIYEEGGYLDVFQISFEVVDKRMSEIICKHAEQIVKYNYEHQNNS